MSILDKFKLDGRVALVTGASAFGIGSASAKALAEAGAKVFLVDCRDDVIRETADRVKAAGGEVDFAVCDVSDEAACEAAVKACVDSFGRLDIMVLAAGISGISASAGFDAIFDTGNWRQVNGVNLDGVWFMVKYGHVECAKGGAGSIILVGSLASYIVTGNGAYTAAKGAIHSLTHFLGKYLGSASVRVNAIHPGLIDTEMTHVFADSDMAKEIYAQSPVGRVGAPDDCALGVLYLASDAASYVTCQHLVIDGGAIFK